MDSCLSLEGRLYSPEGYFLMNGWTPGFVAGRRVFFRLLQLRMDKMDWISFLQIKSTSSVKF